MEEDEVEELLEDFDSAGIIEYDPITAHCLKDLIKDPDYLMEMYNKNVKSE